MTGADRIFIAFLALLGIMAIVKIIMWLAIAKVSLMILTGG